jgi:hypothetical protein
VFYRRTLVTVSAALLALTLAACGSSSTPSHTVAVTHTVTVLRQAAPADTLGSIAADAPLDTAPIAAAEPVKRTTSAFKRCDTNITAMKHTTTCAFAENVFYRYWRSGSSPSIRAYSPATGKTYGLRCTEAAARVACTAGDGAVARFSASSVDRYTSAQARAYVDSHDVGTTAVPAIDTPPVATPDPIPVAPPPPPPSSAVVPDFCSTHDCIPNYPNGNGSTVQCSDGSYSQSGGIQGACSHHGGVG